MQSSTRIHRHHCLKPLPSPGACGFIDPDGTHPLTWHREEERGNSFPGSHWLAPGHEVCVVFQPLGAGILDQPPGRPNTYICLSWPLISCSCQHCLQAACRQSLIKGTSDYAILPLSPLLPGSHCFQDTVQASYVTSKSVHDLAPQAFLPSPLPFPPGQTAQGSSNPPG